MSHAAAASSRGSSPRQLDPSQRSQNIEPAVEP